MRKQCKVARNSFNMGEMMCAEIPLKRRLLGLALLAIFIWLAVVDGKVMHNESRAAAHPGDESIKNSQKRWKKTQFINFCISTPFFFC